MVVECRRSAPGDNRHAPRRRPSRTPTPSSGWRIRPTARRWSPPEPTASIKVWDARTLRETQRLEAQPDWVMGLALSADGRWLAAGRYDGTLGLYALAPDGPGEHSWFRGEGKPWIRAQRSVVRVQPSLMDRER